MVTGLLRCTSQHHELHLCMGTITFRHTRAGSQLHAGQHMFEYAWTLHCVCCLCLVPSAGHSCTWALPADFLPGAYKQPQQCARYLRQSSLRSP